MIPPINYGAVLVAGIVAMVLGWLWYGPLFGKAWITMMGWTSESMEAAKKNGMALQYSLMFVGSLVMAFVLDHSLIFAVGYLHMGGIAGALMGAFWNWLGFIAPVLLGSVLWEGKSWKLWWLNAGYYLVSLALMSIVLIMWA